MPTVPLTDAECQEVYDAWVAHGKHVTRAAEALGMSNGKFSHRLRTYHKRQDIDPAVRNAQLAAGTDMVPKLAWVKTKSEDGASYSVMLKPEEDGPEAVVDRLRMALEGMEPAKIIPAPEHSDSDLLTVYPIADRHQGMRAWKAEVGESYDNEIASERMKAWMARCVASSPNSETAVILDIGDGEHIDDANNVTPKSKHPLDADGRVFLTLETSVETLAYCVEIALGKHQKVIVRILPGNHNPTLYMAVMFALAERYRDNPRVEVQKVPGEFFVHVFGSNMIAATHGDKIKADRMVMFMADEFAEQWGQTRHRFLWTGHLHNHKAQDIGGVAWEQLRPVTPRDAYAYSHAYSGRSQLQAVTLHRAMGEVQRVKVCA